MANSSNSQEYSVESTDFAVAQFRQLARTAIMRGRGRELARAMVRAQKRLRKAPFEVGEPLYRLRHMKMLICRAVFPPLFIEYGVHEDRPVVIIRHVAGLADAID